jgi:hypothetical protein
VRAPADPEEVLVGAAVGLGGLTPRLSRWAQLLNDQGAFGLEDLVTVARAVE